MTSNLGSHVILEESDPARRQQQLEGILREAFRPEFLNRIDEVITFSRLTPEELRLIVKVNLKDIQQRLDERDIMLVVTEAALDHLAARGYDPQYGARPLRRLIQRTIQDPLAMKMLDGELTGHQKVTVDERNGELTFAIENMKEAPVF
ncbi:hypothetical protein [Sulfobacillus thermotolerans]